MMKPRSASLTGLTLIAVSIISADLAAHTTILGKNTPDDYYSRTEPDGSSAVNDFSIPHGCNGEPVIASIILFPNSDDLVAEDQHGNPISSAEVYTALEAKNNLVMGPKPARDANWKFQEVLTGEVPLYNNHGDRDTDVRAFTYKGGIIKNDFLSLSRWRAKFAKIKDNSCVEKIEVRIPIVNYCQHGPKSPARIDAWMGRETAVFNNDNGVVVSTPPYSRAFWPQTTIVNTGYTGLDASGAACAEAMTYKVSPSDADIDMYMPLQGFNP